MDKVRARVALEKAKKEMVALEDEAEKWKAEKG